nr:hypothetical protein Ade03nite_90170 [Actinoplanes derwentensis]
MEAWCTAPVGAGNLIFPGHSHPRPQGGFHRPDRDGDLYPDGIVGTRRARILRIRLRQTPIEYEIIMTTPASQAA